MEKRHKQVECPHCHEQIIVTFRLDIIDVSGKTDEEKREVRWSDGLSEKEIGIVTDADATGILAAFSQVVKKAKGAEAPRFIERFFLYFLKTTRAIAVPAFVLNHYVKAFGPGHIEFWSTQGIVVVLAEGVIKAFIPLDFVRGKPVGSAGGNSGIKARLPVDQADFLEWTRTRFGYVVGKGAFFQNMKKRCIGEFDDFPKTGISR